MTSQPDPPVGLTGARFGRVRRDTPDPEAAPEPSPPEARPAPTGARFGRVRRVSAEPEDEPFESDGRPAPTGARYGRTSGGRKRPKRDARAESPTGDGALPVPPVRPDPDITRWSPTPEEVEPGSGHGPHPDPFSAPTVRVRPYVHTGGRTRTHTPLPIEALVCTVPGSSGLALHGTHRSVLELCRVPQSVAEVSALLGVPLAVARVLVDDLIAERAVTVHRGVDESAPDLALMRRVLSGLQHL